MKGPRGAKTTLVRDAIARMQDRFTVKDVEQAFPGVSREMVRYVLRQIKNKGMVECLGRGLGAQWIKKGNSS
jgi:predicted transcriptional regulator of viral defense system